MISRIGRHALIVVLPLSMLSVLAMKMAMSQGAAASAAATDATPPSAVTQGRALLPGLDDLMTILVQPRHLRLYYAGIRSNWELAAAESQNLRSALRRVAETVPMYLNRDVQEAVTAMLTPGMQAVDAAIAAGDAKRFTRAYSNLTAACNACHAYMEHPYLLIKVPDSPARSVYSDQNFGPTH